MIIQTLLKDSRYDDPYRNYVVLLMHMDGTNDSTTFIDEIGATVTTVGGSKISTTQSKFGGASARFGNANSDWLTVPSVARYGIGSQAFTMEAWVRFDGTPGTQSIFAQRDGAFSEAAFDWFFASGTSVNFAIRDTGGGGTTYTRSCAYSANTWYHMAVSRTSSTLRFFKDGVQQGADVTVSPNTIYLPAATPVAIGNGQRANSVGMVGYMDDLRWTVGVGRYTSNFAPPIAAFP